MKRSRQDPRWPDAHLRLKQLYEERVATKMTQEEFGSLFGIGTQGMVWQYLNGWSPLNYDAAAKFARGLGCTIAEICPPMARSLKVDILPVLGRAAIIAIFCALQFLSTPPARAGYAAPPHGAVCILLNSAASWLCSLIKKLVRFLTVKSHGLRSALIPA